jgi:hypothetical protein
MINYHKETYQLYLFVLSYNTIYLLSKLQIFLNKIMKSKQIEVISNQIEDMMNHEKGDIDVIKYNDVIFQINHEKLYSYIPLYHDFIIYVDKNSIKPYNKMIYYNVNEIPCFEYEMCDYHFVSLNVSINNKKYKLHLHNEKENYYLVNNKINSMFICYLLKKQHGIDIDSFDIKYTLEIMDHNINIKTITEKEEIIFNKKDYTVNSKSGDNIVIDAVDINDFNNK